jgi:enoyl-CoA hydratase/carnithine racemase
MGKQYMTESETQEVLYSVEDHIAVITLNRPERLNTLSRTMLEELVSYFVMANEDPEVRVVIYTGTGRAFCAGLNIREENDDPNSNTTMLGSVRAVTTLNLRQTPPTVIHEMDKPTICALNGSAAGYGMDMAMGCDIRIMSEDAKLAAAFCKRGILPESGGTWLLPRLMGWQKAAEVIFTGRTLSAAECLEYGLVAKVVPAASVMEEALKLAREIAGNAPLAVQAAKRMMRMGYDEPFPDHVHHVYLQLAALTKTEDVKEGMAAFLEKRIPLFKGR